MPKVTIPLDAYHDYETFTGYLKAVAAAHPGLCTLTCAATSHRGRDVWLMTLKNAATGPDIEKPGYYMEAQIHAEEHATSAVALHFLWTILEQYGSNPDVTRLMDGQAFYVFPRLNPDGAELALQPPYHPWCGNGRYLPGEERGAGLMPADVDGDGYITSMRVKDPKGEWKVSSRDPRLMVQREPGEEGGTYYRLYPEGTIRDYDGAHVVIERPDDGNLNRNFPANWSPREYGAGKFPLDEPESRAVSEIRIGKPNICGVSSYHTHGGIILRPSMTKPDAAMTPRDLALYKDLGEVGTRLTCYPTISTYEDFTPDKTKPRYGSLKDWTYEEMGIISFSTELWDLETEAGCKKVAYYNLRPRNEDIQQRVFEWVLANVGAHGFRDWRRVDHPQLGEVEIGGMVYTWSYRNPPPPMLPEICRKNVAFNIAYALAAPRVVIDSLVVEPLGADLHRVKATIANHGYLPTNLSDVAITNGVAKPVAVTLSLEGAELVMNPGTVDLGHLAGRNERKYTWSPWSQQWSATTRIVEWLVKGESGASVTVEAASAKGGTARASVRLG